MNITKKDIDSLNAILTVQISKDDYTDKVDAVLNNYRKTANIPGFRKGRVPMGMVRKQYGKAVLIEEVNKLLQENLHKYLTEEKIDVLGNPLPKNDQDIDWNANDFSFEFELGLAPVFEVDVKKKAITHYKVIADKKMIDNQIKTIQKQYGKLISEAEVSKEVEITGTFTAVEKEIENKVTFSIDDVKGKKQITALIGSKVGDTVSLKTKDLFENEGDYHKYLGISKEDFNGIEVNVAIEEINRRELALLNKELFDKLFGENVVSSVEELEEKIKKDAEKQFEQQSDQKLLNDVIESLIENTKFELPSAFLQRWIQTSGEKELTEEEAKLEFEKSEKGLRYQLIEGKLRTDNNLQVTFEELKEYAKEMIKNQMAQYGQLDPSDEELEGIVARIMGNQDEVKRLNEQLNTNKVLQFFKDNAKLKTKEITYEKFIKEAYA